MKYRYRYTGVEDPAICSKCGLKEGSRAAYRGGIFFIESKNYLCICELCVEKLENNDPDWACGLESTGEYIEN